MSARGFGVGALLLAAVVIGGGGAAREAGYRLNTTPSLPLGLWQAQTGRAVRRGDVVTFCPPATVPFRLAHARHYLAAGTCPSGFELMMKPVVAVAGDVVTIGAGGIAVDGKVILKSRPLAQDSLRRTLTAMAPGRYSVAQGQIWVVSSYNPRSYDSRYFGPVGLKAVRGEARPIWIEGAP